MHSLASVIAVVVLGLACNRTALRGVETLTTALSKTVRKMFGIRRRMSDTTLSEAREGQRRFRFGRTPERIAAATICRMIAQNVLGQLRALFRPPPATGRCRAGAT